jgi:hypothetical protein
MLRGYELGDRTAPVAPATITRMVVPRSGTLAAGQGSPSQTRQAPF